MSTATKKPRNNCDHALTALETDVLADWRDLALCAGLNMHPAEDGNEEAEALAICQACPVRAECSSWVMPLNEYSDPGGVCGGLTERRRQAIRRSAAIKAGMARAGASQASEHELCSVSIHR